MGFNLVLFISLSSRCLDLPVIWLWSKIFCLTFWQYHKIRERQPLLFVFTLYALWKQYASFILSVSTCHYIGLVTRFECWLMLSLLVNKCIYFTPVDWTLIWSIKGNRVHFGIISRSRNTDKGKARFKGQEQFQTLRDTPGTSEGKSFMSKLGSRGQYC